MQIVEKEYLNVAIEMLLNDKQKIHSSPLRALCLQLLQSTTPYLGHHDLVENALEEFVKAHW